MSSNKTEISKNIAVATRLSQDLAQLIFGYRGQGIISIFSNSSAFAALSVDGSVVGWGNSKYGGNNSDMKIPSVKYIFSNRHAFAALTPEGNVVTWGNDRHGGKTGRLRRRIARRSSGKRVSGRVR